MSTLQTTNLKHPDSSGTQVTFTSGGDTTVAGSTTFSSPIKASKLENASTTNGGVEIDADGHVQVDGQQLPTTGSFGTRSMIINGDMVVAQRGASHTSEDGQNNYGIDRFKVVCPNTDAVLAHTQESSGGPEGFKYWLKITPTTADTAIGADNYSTVQQIIEGSNFVSARYGTSEAKRLAISFKFKTNKAGTYCMIHRNQTANRNFLHEFTPVADGNWQTISYSIPGDTTGTWQTNNDIGWRFELCLANGSSFQSSTTESWFSGQYFHSTPSQVNFLDNTGNELGITAVQVELGEKSTPFEFLPFDQALLRCQRYYYTESTGRYVNGYKRHDDNCYWKIYTPVSMRTSPTATLVTSGTFTNFNSNFSTTQTDPNVFEYSTSSASGVLNVESDFSSTHVSIPSWEGYVLQYAAEL